MYGGRTGQQEGARVGRSDDRTAIARTLLAAVCAVAAATRGAWYDAIDDSMRVEILAPQGHCGQPPTRVVWSASRAVAQLQLDWVDGERRPWLRRSFDPPIAAGAFALTMDERSTIGERRGGAIAALALTRDGEWLAESGRAVVRIDGRVRGR